MIIYECVLHLMENVYFCSRQLDNEYQTFGFISNTALPYALKLVRLHDVQLDLPNHKQDFEILNDNYIYITPATFPDPIKFSLNRSNSIPERSDLIWNIDSDSQARQENYPDEGWIKEIDRDQKAIFYIISYNDKSIKIPTYIRLGKYHSKCKIEYKKVDFEIINGLIHSDLYLRCEDIDPKVKIIHPKLFPIQHSTFLYQLNFIGDGVKIKTDYFKDSIIPCNSKFYIAIE